MGCHLQKSNSISSSHETNLYYKIPEQLYRGFKKNAHIFNHCQKSYIIMNSSNAVLIYDIDGNRYVQSNIEQKAEVKGVFTKQKKIYVQSRDYLHKLCLIGDQFIVKNRYHNKYHRKMKTCFIDRFQSIILEQKIHTIRLKSLQLQKQIFRIKSFAYQKNFDYLPQNGFIIYSEKSNDAQYYICIGDIRSRQVIIRQKMFNIRQIVAVQYTEEILVKIFGQGLYLYKINYQSKMIQQQKILNLNPKSICQFDDNNLLNLITLKTFIKFDKFYNVIQRFNIFMNYVDINYNLKINVRFKHNLPEIICFQGKSYDPQFLLFKQIKSSKDSQNDMQLSECKNYKTEYLFYTNQYKQHLISPNLLYLAFINYFSLMFHRIQGGADVYLHLGQSIKFINFSSDSNSFYIVLDQIIYCYKTRQNMKREFQYNQIVDKLQTDQPGIIISINSQGSVMAISKKLRKIIFKLRTIYKKQKYRSFDYDTQRGTILVSSDREVSLFNLADRRLIIKDYWIENRQCKLIQNTQNLLILTYNQLLLLWSYENRFLNFKKEMILGKVSIILQGYQDLYCFRMINQIIIMNQEFQIVEKIYYKTAYYQNDPQYDIISRDDQIIQKGLILRVSFIPLRHQILHYEHYEKCQNIILSLEPRQSNQ